MRRAIREHLRDFLAIIGLIVAGVVTTFIILGSQSTALPSWLPLLGEERFEIKAEFSSAQAVTPGQGQAVTIAGNAPTPAHSMRMGTIATLGTALNAISRG